jgi:toxin HigB-1
VIESFAEDGTEDIYEGRETKAARRACPASLWAIARRKLDQLDAAMTLNDLRVPPGNRLEALKGSRLGQHSIRVNQQYRICFKWMSRGPTHVSIVDYH